MQAYAELYTDRVDNLMGMASLTTDEGMTIRGIKIMHGKNGTFFSMPQVAISENGKTRYKDIVYYKTEKEREQVQRALEEATKQALDRIIVAEDVDGFTITARVTPLEERTDNLRGIATVTINEKLVVKNVMIMNGSKGLFVSMPKYKTIDRSSPEAPETVWHDYVFPSNPKMQEKVKSMVLDSYQNALKKELPVNEQPAKKMNNPKNKETIPKGR